MQRPGKWRCPLRSASLDNPLLGVGDSHSCGTGHYLLVLGHGQRALAVVPTNSLTVYSDAR